VSDDEIRADVRGLRRSRRLGVEPACVLCGRTNAHELHKVRRSLLERHHLAGRVNDERLTVCVCWFCHARLSERQLDSGVDRNARPARSTLDQLVGVLLGLADFFAELAEALGRWADELTWIVHRLDETMPGWRDQTNEHSPR